MDVEIQDAGPCRKLLKITVPVETVKQELDTQYTTLAESAEIKGFRKGHAPRRLLEKRFGEDINEQAKEKLVITSISESLEKHELKAIGDPDIKEFTFSPEAPLTFEASIDVAPTFDVDGYKGFKISRPAVEVTDEAIDHEIQHLRERTAELKPAPDGVAAKGDVIVAEATVEVEGKPAWTEQALAFEVGTTHIRHFTVEALPDLATGKKVGDEFTATAKLPENAEPAELAGKEGALRVKVREIKRPFFPEVDEEWAKGIGAKSLDDLRTKLRQSVTASKKVEAEVAFETRIEDALLGQINFNLPERLVESETRRLQAIRRLRMLQLGMPKEEIEKRDESLSQSAAQDALRSCKLFFIMQKIAEKERIFATEEEIEARIAQMATRRQTPAAKLKAHLDESGELSNVRTEIREEKTMEFLKQHVVSE